MVGLEVNGVKKVKVGDYLETTANVRWNGENDVYEYIDLSSIDRATNSITETKRINQKTARRGAKQVIKFDDILFGTTRPLLKRIYRVENKYDNQICSTGFCVLRAKREKLLPKWIYFSLSSDRFYDYVENYQEGTSYPSISDKKVKAYEILLPSLPVQEYVVSILDQFDSLVNDISQGLPKEIDLRQKEYEYYRERLLDFPRD